MIGIFLVFAAIVFSTEFALCYQIYQNVLEHNPWGIVYWAFWSWIFAKICVGIQAVNKDK